MPERHGKHSGHAEDQREGEKVPLFPEEIDACVSKKFHAAYDPFKNLLFAVRRSLFAFRHANGPREQQTTNSAL
jgi:hypothetical protein